MRWAKRGWQQVTCRQYGKEVVKKIKAFEATYEPAGGRIRVVLVDETDGWLPFFSTDPAMAATTILEQKADRGTLEQDYHDLKEVEGTGQQQLRNIWANIGAFHLTMWTHCLTELWAWYQHKEALSATGSGIHLGNDPQRRRLHMRIAVRAAYKREVAWRRNFPTGSGDSQSQPKFSVLSTGSFYQAA